MYCEFLNCKEKDTTNINKTYSIAICVRILKINY